MTDEEYEKLYAEARRILHSGRNLPRKLAARLVSCRDCDREDPEWYMLTNELWRKAVPTGRGCLCLGCLAKRLGRPLVADDFGDLPHTRDGEPVELSEIPLGSPLARETGGPT
jgi:hypothetical protein